MMWTRTLIAGMWRRVVVFLAVIVLSPAAAAAPQDQEAERETNAPGTQLGGARTADVFPGFRLSGDVGVGFHLVSTGGHVPKYREDIDLGDGIYLGRSRLEMVPGGDDPQSWVDRIVLEGHGFGSHPSASWGVTVQKSGAYKLRVRGRSIDYFNRVTGSPLAWDLTRSNADGDLSVAATENLTFHASFRRFRQDGSRTASRDISRDEFQFEEPLDQVGSVWGLGGRWRSGVTSIFVDQQFSQLDDNARFSEDQLNQGLAPDEAYLLYLEDRQERSIDAPITRAGVATRVAGRLRLSADMLLSSQDLGFAWVRLWEGADFAERPVSESVSASGAARRDVFHTNGRALYDVTDAVRLTARYRRRSWDQDGDQVFSATTAFTETGAFSTSRDEVENDWRVVLNQLLVGIEASPSDAVLLFGEVGLTNREQQFTHDGGDVERSDTQTTSVRIGTRIRPTAGFDIEGSYTLDDVDDPFTRVAPTTTHRAVGKVRFRPRSRLSLTGSVTYRDAENDLTPARLNSTAYGFTVAYNGGPERWLVAGYHRVDIDREVLTTWRPFFAGSATDTFSLDLADASVSVAGEYRLSNSIPLTVYGRAIRSDSASLLPVGVAFGGLGPRLRASAAHDIDVLDITIGGRYRFGDALYADLGYRYVEYEEATGLPSAADDYSARVITLGFGLRF